MKYDELFSLRKELIKKKVKGNNLSTYENKLLGVINSQIKGHDKKIGTRYHGFQECKDIYKDKSMFYKGFGKAFNKHFIAMYKGKEGN